MKTYSVLFCVILNACAALAQEGTIVKVEYSSATRGYQKQIFITQDSLISIADGRAGNGIVKRKIDSVEWKQVKDVLAYIRPAELPELSAPSSRRAFDGARHSTIALHLADGNVYSHAFDDEFPHEKLRKLMKLILDISNFQPKN